MDSRIIKMSVERIEEWELSREEKAEVLKKLIAANGFKPEELFDELGKKKKTAEPADVYGEKLKYPLVYENAGICAYRVKDDVLTGVVFEHDNGKRFVWRAKLDMVKRTLAAAKAYAASLPPVLGKNWRVPDDKHCLAIVKNGPEVNNFLLSVGADAIPPKAILTDKTKHPNPPEDWFCGYIAELD